MRRCSGSTLLVFVFLSFAVLLPHASAQADHITIGAGTDEDHALQAITSEQDPQKKTAMYEEFVQKFSSNPAAVAYGDWQLSQAYQATGDLPKALDYGDKALAASPRNLDILVSEAGIAQQAKNNLKLMDYAAKGGEVCAAVAKQTKPEGMSDEDFASKVKEEKESVQNSCDFLESSGLNAIASETDPKNRMAEIEKFSAAFPDSKYQDQVSNYAMYTLGPDQLNDKARLVSFGEKTLASNPNSLAALLLLANYYGDDTKPGSAAKAITYSQKAIEVAKPDAPDADKSRKIAAGVAHNTIGWAYLKQEKTGPAITELKTASVLLKGQDEQQYARALYGLGFAYAKLNKLTEAREVLTDVAKIQGPFQAMSQDLLTKVNTARAKGK
jgi:tetratricopeptide (TPR) repeat protein